MFWGWSDAEILGEIELRGMVFISRLFRGWKHDDAVYHLCSRSFFRSKLDFGGVERGTWIQEL